VPDVIHEEKTEDEENEDKPHISNGERLPPLPQNLAACATEPSLSKELTININEDDKTYRRGLGMVANDPKLHTEFYLTGPDAQVRKRSCHDILSAFLSHFANHASPFLFTLLRKPMPEIVNPCGRVEILSPSNPSLELTVELRSFHHPTLHLS
jgi:hypothetical protein